MVSKQQNTADNPFFAFSTAGSKRHIVEALNINNSDDAVKKYGKYPIMI